MAFRIDQAGLALGTTGKSRTDGKLDGSLVTLTNTSGGTTLFQLLWVPPGDTTAVASLAATVPGSATWTFSPTANRPGTYRIRLIRDQGSPFEVSEVRVFRVRTATKGLPIPALNEVADFRASLLNNGSTVVAASEDNATDYAGSLSALAYSGWWRMLHEWVIALEAAGTGGGGSYDVVSASADGLAPETAAAPFGSVLGFDDDGNGIWGAPNERVFQVGSGYGMYSTIQAAIDAINLDPPSSNDERALILIWPGNYVSTTPYIFPQYTSVRGVNRTEVTLENSTTHLVRLKSDVEITNLTIKGVNNDSISAFDNNGEGTQRVTLRAITMAGATHCLQKFATMSGTVWEGLLIKDVLVFSTRVSGYTCEFNAAANRATSVYIEDTQMDNYLLTGTGGCLRYIAGWGNRIVRCRLRGDSWFEGIALENGGQAGTDLRIYHSYLGNDGFGGASTKGVVAQSSTTYTLINTDAEGSTTAGTRTCRNSFPAS
ncbi:hypothetical protein UFOVP650_65 [uncultured Caudovirales phage]|uniref:Uncharacterized protein n=1 Tax=uncultured Caudovirales phage TaxID=2100421 RepID=A0A6J5N8E2_9CAUD|nr:hypothetical protein UFOVP650_65 [uncultured Caudovirales phage]